MKTWNNPEVIKLGLNGTENNDAAGPLVSFKCDVCHTIYTDYYEALNCENSHGAPGHS